MRRVGRVFIRPSVLVHWGIRIRLLLALGLASAGTVRAAGRIEIAGGRFVVDGRPIWINGANTPWHHWNDFGGEFDAQWWDGHFRALHESGINASRVWISCSGDVGVLIDGRGQVSGATAAHWRDLDQLFASAERHQVHLMATLMSFDHFRENHASHGKWRAWLQSDSAIDSYVANYLRPFLDRYGRSPVLWSIDLMNEPDWVVENKENGRIPWARLQAYFARAAREIHARSPVLVTVGTAMPKYNSDTAADAEGNQLGDAALRSVVDDPGARLDFYSVHYYDWCGRHWGNALGQTPAAFGMPVDKPNVIGEFPASGTRGRTTAEDYESAFQHGWQGAMGWTSNGVDKNGDLGVLGTATAAFRDRRPQLVFPAR